MKLSSLVVGAISAIAVIAVVLLIAGVHFERPVALQGAALYNPADEIVVQGVVREIKEFTCPVSEGEMGEHLVLKTDYGITAVHLAPGRVLRSQRISFAAGDQLSAFTEAMTSLHVRSRGATKISYFAIAKGS